MILTREDGLGADIIPTLTKFAPQYFITTFTSMFLLFILRFN